MEAAHASWRPLGELIVERGLITHEQLEDALLEQRITRKRLGTILVEKGIVSAETLTNALVDQIGVDELLDEFDEDGTDRSDESGKRRISLRNSTQRLASPFARLRIRREDDSGPVAPFGQVVDEDDDEPEAYVPFSLVRDPVEAPASPEPEPESEATQEIRLEPEPEPEAAQPEPEPAPKAEAASQPAAEPASTDDGAPHAWLAAARSALEQAEADLAQLDDALATRGYELLEIRAELTEVRTGATRANEARANADREVSRLKKSLAETAASEVALKRTVEDLRERETIANSELSALRGELDRTKKEIQGAKQTLTHQAARIADVETTFEDHERRGKRIAELEAKKADLEGQATELSARLAAASETLGVESNARDLAEQESQRLQTELAERDDRLEKLVQRIETLEAEVDGALTERVQLQSKLESRERRLTKLDATVAELRSQVAAAQPLTETKPKPEPVAEAKTEPEPVVSPEPAPAADSKAVAAETGFLFFVPKSGEGYELVEHDGDAPAVGDTVELSGATFSVTRHGRSPLPFDKRVCVYLRAA
jgi:predicted  nucleic acid-binding Zn-ribbon protein